MTHIYPGAHYRPVSSHSGPMTEHLGLVLHVAEANGSLAGYFGNPSHRVSSTWWAAKGGEIEQYVDADLAAWAQGAGNATYNSVETEGYHGEPLTPAQVDAIAHLYAWGRRAYGWPLRIADQPGEPGLGWHGMGGIAWGGHLSCPGDLRKAQRAEIIREAAAILNRAAPIPPWYHRLLCIQRPYLYGKDVEIVQGKVRVRVDGSYGPITATAVKSFQGQHHLAQDGIVGPDTAKALG